MRGMRKQKRLWLSSVLSLVFSCALLLGVTFSWFTKVVPVGNNEIRTGTLDAVLFYDIDSGRSGEHNWNEVTESTNLFEGVWGQGSEKVIYLRTVNQGELPVRYQIAMHLAEFDDGGYEQEELLEQVKISWSDGERELKSTLKEGFEIEGTLAGVETSEHLTTEITEDTEAAEAEAIYRVVLSIEDHDVGVIDASEDTGWDIDVSFIVTQDTENISFDVLKESEAESTECGEEEES